MEEFSVKAHPRDVYEKLVPSGNSWQHTTNLYFDKIKEIYHPFADLIVKSNSRSSGCLNAGM